MKKNASTPETLTQAIKRAKTVYVTVFGQHDDFSVKIAKNEAIYLADSASAGQFGWTWIENDSLHIDKADFSSERAK